MRIESSQGMLNHIDGGGNLTLDSQGQLETQSSAGKFFQKIGDAFRSLTESGRAAIAARNENLYAAMADMMRQDRLVNPSETEIPNPMTTQAERNACAMRLSVAHAALQLPEESRAAARNFALAEMHVKNPQGQGDPNVIQREAQAIMQRIQANPVLRDGMRCDYSRTDAQLQPLLAEMDQDSRADFMRQKDRLIDADGMHESYVKDARRGSIRSINGHDPDSTDFAGEFAALIPDPKIRGFCSMMASQAGLEGALCKQLMMPGRARDNALLPSAQDMMQKNLLITFPHHKYDISVEGAEARIRIEMDAVVSGRFCRPGPRDIISPLGGGRYAFEMVVDLSQDMTDKDIPDFALVNASRTPVYSESMMGALTEPQKTGPPKKLVYGVTTDNAEVHVLSP